MVRAVRQAYRPGQPLIDYRREDFEIGAALPVLRAAFSETRDGRGIALVRGLPRDMLSEPEFELLTWAIGLHAGVPRPQGKATHYLSAVRDVGTVYRSGTGRGYSSNAELDFHTDGADVVALTCFNTAKAGGMSMVSSSVTAHNIMAVERRISRHYCMAPSISAGRRSRHRTRRLSIRTPFMPSMVGGCTAGGTATASPRRSGCPACRH